MKSRIVPALISSYHKPVSSLCSISTASLLPSTTSSSTSQIFMKPVNSYRHLSTRQTFQQSSTLLNKKKPTTSCMMFSSTTPTNNNSNNDTTTTTSAPRAARAVSLLPTYLADARAVEKYNGETAPDGALQLSVAENQMLEDLLVPSLTKFYTTNDYTFPADAIYYQPTHGRESLRQVFATYLQNLLELDRPIDPNGLVIGAGCNAVLENLCLSLAEPGQGVMIPLPYYAAFEFDLGSRAGLKTVPVPTMKYQGYDPSSSSDTSEQQQQQQIPEQAYYPNRESLDAAKRTSIEQNGIEPRILLLSHPQNPLGVCYPPDVVQEIIDWCRDNQIHLVSDEIYAGSVYRPDEAKFVSALKLAASSSSSPTDDDNNDHDNQFLGLGPYIHFVYALSKDYALSGLRVGALYSENQDIRLPLQKLNDLCCVSSQTQLLVERMMSERVSSSTTTSGVDGDDDEVAWTSQFLEENHRRLRQRGDAWMKCLDELNIPYLRATAGLFCWMDFSEFLPSVDSGTIDERERALYLELLQEFGLLFTPGRSMKNERPGFFRCVFTAASDEEFSLGMIRLRKYVETKRQ